MLQTMQNLWEKSNCLISVQPPHFPSTHFRLQFFPQTTYMFLNIVCYWSKMSGSNDTVPSKQYPQFQFSQWGHTYHMGTSSHTELGINHQVIWQISDNSLFSVPTSCTKSSCRLRLRIVRAQARAPAAVTAWGDTGTHITYILQK